MIKTIGIIGSGHIGGALARLAVAAGLDVVLSNSRGPDTLAEFTAELGGHARADTPERAARAGDLVVAAIPLNAYASLPAAALVGRAVIDTMNYYPERDSRIAELDAGALTSSEMVQQHLPASYVVKGFNNIDFHRLFTSARPGGAPGRSALPIAGDNRPAKEHAAQLADALGYDTIDIGTLADSWRSEPGTPVYVQPYMGKRPAASSNEDVLRHFLEAPGIPVSAARAWELVNAAVRPAANG